MVRLKNRYLLVHILYPSNRANATLNNDVEKVTKSQKLLMPPTSRLLHIHAPTPDSVNAASITRLLRAQTAFLFGDAGAAAVNASLAVKYWSNATSTFIVRVARAAVRLLWTAITFLNTLPVAQRDGRGVASKSVEQEITMQVLRVSGTIKKCEEEAVRRARALCGRVNGLQLAIDAGITSMNENDRDQSVETETSHSMQGDGPTQHINKKDKQDEEDIGEIVLDDVDDLSDILEGDDDDDDEMG